MSEDRRRHLPWIAPGDDVALSDGAIAFGAVRKVLSLHPPVLMVDVEGGGDFRVPLDAVTRVGLHRVIVRWDRLDEPTQEAIRHALDREDFPPEGEDIELVGAVEDTGDTLPDRYR